MVWGLGYGLLCETLVFPLKKERKGGEKGTNGGKGGGICDKILIILKLMFSFFIKTFLLMFY